MKISGSRGSFEWIVCHRHDGTISAILSDLHGNGRGLVVQFCFHRENKQNWAYRNNGDKASWRCCDDSLRLDTINGLPRVVQEVEYEVNELSY
jgi:hypothetical protein